MAYVKVGNSNLVIAHGSDEGRSGKNNEDNYALFEARFQANGDASIQLPVLIAVIADGIGGSVSGEVASQTAIESMVRGLTGKPIQQVGQRLEQAIHGANRDIFTKAQEAPHLRGMGTTVVAAAILNNQLYLAHAGDSRAYLVRRGQIYLLTLDHSWAQEAIDAGYLTLDQAQRHPNRNVIKRFLGPLEHVDVDHTILDVDNRPGNVLLPQYRVLAADNHLALQPGDLLLLCSDGLSDVVSEHEILETVTSYGPGLAVPELIRQANAAGGPDNITALIVQLPGTPGPASRHIPAAASVKTEVVVPAVGPSTPPPRSTSRNLAGRLLLILAVLMGLTGLGWIAAQQLLPNLFVPGTALEVEPTAQLAVADRAAAIPAPGAAAGGAAATGLPTPTPVAAATVAPASEDVTAPPSAAAPTVEPIPTEAEVDSTTADPEATPDDAGEATAIPVVAAQTAVLDAVSPMTDTVDTAVPVSLVPAALASAVPITTPLSVTTSTPVARGTVADQSATEGATATPATTATSPAAPANVAATAATAEGGTPRAATSTPARRTTPTPTVTPTLMPTPTLRPAAPVTPVPAGARDGENNTPATAIPAPPAAPASALPAPGSVMLIAPMVGSTLNAYADFEWILNDPAAARSDLGLELIIWPAGAGGEGWRSGFSPQGATSITHAGNWKVGVALASFEASHQNLFSPGSYLWGVALVQMSPFRRHHLLSEPRLFVYERPGGGGGGGDDDGGGGGGGGGGSDGGGGPGK